MSIRARTHDFDGIWVDPLPVPRIVRGGAQAFPQLRKSYTDQLEEELIQSQEHVLKLEAQMWSLRDAQSLREQLEAQVQDLREQLEFALARPPTIAPAFLGSGKLARARQHIQRQQEKIRRLEIELREVIKPAAKSTRVGRLNVNVPRRRVELGRRSFTPTGGELSLLVYLAQRPDRILDTATIAAGIGCSDASARTFMWRLRPKMEAIGAADYLRSRGSGGAWGGYWMTASSEIEEA